MEERCADPTTQEAVDEAILDYLLYTAIRSLLHDQQDYSHNGSVHTNPLSAELPLQMVDCAKSAREIIIC